MDHSEINIRISARKTVRFLSFMVIGLVLTSIASRFCLYILNYSGIYRLLNLFYVDSERSIATWYSSMSLLFCSFLLAVIAFSKSREGDRWVRYWQGLSLIFLALSIDEGAEIHELAINRVRSALNVDSISFAAWVIPAAVLVFLFFLLYLRFLLSLPTSTRLLFISAGVTYVGGAMIVEVLGGSYASGYGMDNFTYTLFATFEEVLEMTGVLIFIYTLLSYINTHCKPPSILFSCNQRS